MNGSPEATQLSLRLQRLDPTTVDITGLLPPATYLGQLQCRAQLATRTGQRRHKSLQSIFLLLSDREETGGQLPTRQKALSCSLRRRPCLGQPPSGTPVPRGRQGPWQLALRGLPSKLRAQLVASSAVAWPSGRRPRIPPAAAKGSPRAPALSVGGQEGLLQVGTGVQRHTQGPPTMLISCRCCNK